MIYAIKHLFLIDCIRFWFELINQKNEMKNKKMAHFTFIIFYHLPFESDFLSKILIYHTLMFTTFKKTHL
jgi:hypothetical protein